MCLFISYDSHAIHVHTKYRILQTSPENIHMDFSFILQLHLNSLFSVLSVFLMDKLSYVGQKWQEQDATFSATGGKMYQ